MADATVGVLQSTTPDRLIDNDSLTVGANTVYRQRVRVSGAAATDLMTVTGGAASVAVASALPTGTNSIGTVILGAGAAAIGTVGVTSLPALPIGGNSIGLVGLNAGSNVIGHVITDAGSVVTATAPAITKGTQAATGFTVQELKDAGRNVTNYFTVLPIVTTATEALLSLTGYKGGAAVAATTTPAVVTAAKTYRITRIDVTYVAIATAGSTRISLRVNTGGVVAVTSPVVWQGIVGGPAAVAGVAETVAFDFPDGLEIPAGAGIGISQLGLGATQAAAVVGYGAATVVGFEY